MRRFGIAKIVVVSSLIVSVLLHLVGVTFAPVIVCVAAGVCVLPSIAVMRSLVGRLFFSTVLFFAVFQIATVIQYFVLPSSHFTAAAAITAAIYLSAVLLTDVTASAVRERIGGLCDRHDAAGFIIAAIFLLPFIPMLIGDDTVARVAQIGGSQAIDATNHFSIIAHLMEQQHLGYSTTSSYYPSGFHIAAAFLQDSLSISQTSMAWRHNVFLFMGQYLVLGVLVAGAIGYFVSGVFMAVAARYSTGRAGFLLYSASIAAGAIAGPTVLWPFVQQGFLSYFYVIVTILVAFTVLLTGTEKRLFSTVSLYLVLIFGAGMSWPLLLPPLLATLALVLCRKSCLQTLRSLPKLRLLCLAVLVGMQLLPLAFQLLFSTSGGGQGINSLGGLRAFHPLSLLVSALLVMAMAANRTMGHDSKDKGIALLLPTLTFVGLLALMQLFLVGEVRYYVIKTAFLLEALNLVFLSCLVAVALSRTDLGAVGKFFAGAIVPVVVVFSLFAVTANPLTDVRLLFRTEARAEKPLFFDADLRLYTELGNAGKVDGFNTTLLHYDSVKKTFFAHMQIPTWANMMQYDAQGYDWLASACNGQMYTNLAFGTASAAEQRDLIRTLKQCARDARDLGKEFIIVTDPGSAGVVREEFGGLATIEAR